MNSLTLGHEPKAVEGMTDKIDNKVSRIRDKILD